MTSLGDISARVEAARARHHRVFPGEREERQPVHTVYVPADRFTATTARDFGAEARRLLDTHAPDAESLAAVFGIPPGLAGTVRERLAAKLAAEPIEDVRIDFEDGYGERLDVEEDAHVAQAIEAVAIAYETKALPYYWGLRVKSFADGGHERAMRTLDGFLTGLRNRLGRLPGGFVITFPKVVMAEHVAAFADFCGRLEAALGLPARQLRFEIQVETTEAIVDIDGKVGLRGLVQAGEGRISAAHFGVYDYTAACGLPPAAQRLDHPACDFARHIMQVTLAGTGVRLSDGSTNVVPADDTTARVHEAWRIHAAHVGHSLRHGFRQGWDLHPAHLPSRYAVVYADLLSGIDEVIARVRAWKDGTAAGAGVLDEPATVKTLMARLRRAADCGAVDRKVVNDLAAAPAATTA